MNINQGYIAGFAGADATTRTAQNGKDWTTFNLAHTQKGREGIPDKTTWFQVKAFGYSNEVAQHVKKGDNVLVSGIIQLDSYKDKSGVEKTSLVIIAQQVGILTKDGRKASAGYTVGGRQHPGQSVPGQDVPAPSDDDIPF